MYFSRIWFICEFRRKQNTKAWLFLHKPLFQNKYYFGFVICSANWRIRRARLSSDHIYQIVSNPQAAACQVSNPLSSWTILHELIFRLSMVIKWQMTSYSISIVCFACMELFWDWLKQSECSCIIEPNSSPIWPVAWNTSSGPCVPLFR